MVKSQAGESRLYCTTFNFCKLFIDLTGRENSALFNPLKNVGNVVQNIPAQQHIINEILKIQYNTVYRLN